MKNKNLSDREKEVLYLIAYEHTNKEISEKLHLSTGTIATYRNNILSKLAAKNSAGIVRIAFEKGLLILDAHDKIISNIKIPNHQKSDTIF